VYPKIIEMYKGGNIGTCGFSSGGPYCDCGYKKKGFVKAGTEAGR